MDPEYSKKGIETFQRAFVQLWKRVHGKLRLISDRTQPSCSNQTEGLCDGVGGVAGIDGIGDNVGAGAVCDCAGVLGARVGAAEFSSGGGGRVSPVEGCGVLV